MLELLRKHQHGIMIVVAFVVIIAFAWFFNPYDTRRGSGFNQTIAFRIGSKGVTLKEVERQTRVLQAAEDLGLRFTLQLLQPTFDVVDFTQNRYLLGQEARKLGIDPSEEEVQKAIAAHGQFQRNGTFSEDAYLDAIRNTLEPNGLVAGDLRELMADKIRLEKLEGLISSGVEVPPSVVDVEFQRNNERVMASVVDLKLEDFEKDIEVSDDELQAFYDEQKALLPTLEQQTGGRLEDDQQAAVDLIMAPEKRKIEFVFFEEPEAPAPPVSTPPATPRVPEPPLLLRPEAPGAPAGGPLSAPPIEIPGVQDDEEEPPGQAPEGAESNPLEIEPLQAPPVEAGDLELTPAEELGGDLDAGGLTEEAPAINLEGEPTSGLDFNLDMEELETLPDLDLGGPSEGAATKTPEEHAAEVEAYLAQVDSFYTRALDSSDLDPLNTEAAKDGLEVKTTDFFAEDDLPEDPKVPAKLAAVAFKGSLENDGGILVPVEGLSPKGYYVARLLEVQESSEQSLDSIREAVSEALVKKKAIEAMEAAAEAAREKLMAALSEGKDFAEAAKELELEVRDIPEFSQRDRPTGTDDVTEILAAVPTTTTGSVSEMQRPEDKAILVYVSQRVEAEEAADEEETTPAAPRPPGASQTKEQLATSLESQYSSTMMRLWMEDRRESAEIKRDPALVPPRVYFPQSLFGGGGGLNF